MKKISLLFPVLLLICSCRICSTGAFPQLRLELTDTLGKDLFKQDTTLRYSDLEIRFAGTGDSLQYTCGRDPDSNVIVTCSDTSDISSDINIQVRSLSATIAVHTIVTSGKCGPVVSSRVSMNHVRIMSDHVVYAYKIPMK